MRFEIFEIKEFENYAFVIGTRSKPDSLLKESIRGQIEEAMSSLSREPESYKVSVVQSGDPELGEPDIPTLTPGKKYLIFALLYTGDGQEPFSARDLEEQKEEISRGLFCPPDSRVTLVVLQDASVKAIVSREHYKVHVI